ncbi:type I-D CRISPR-associated protein Cas10d/Csc3 [Dictyobacter arantiisoli]|uniref:Type I-D CRISPR-associated protein Cas10d/Csc3 n=1 Tax=Dictyobacter arantiisoli TaxID=2014874 RepID=A0A5A5TGC4_9CHLR|nr:type I-D CRISPR-associated protein Cas10d/Csc3 [Dictyobacter arantiisoli]GCF10206.1 hypothetical protein KDI_37700 [Dictyobacter arantiisoli]
MDDVSIFGFTYESDDASRVLGLYMQHIASKKLCAYKSFIHTGGKMGESLWSHVINLVTIVEKLRRLFELTEREMSCLCLAITLHDINKLSAYGKQSNGRAVSYANAAVLEHVRSELLALQVEPFFPEWEQYLFDIKYLMDAHQEQSPQQSQHDDAFLDRCLLDHDRLEGPLRYLMKVADVSDNAHSGDHLLTHEKHIRDKFAFHLNAGLYASGHPDHYRFIGYRLAELRGLLTNCIHNQMVAYLQELYGKDVCIDVLYYPEGVDLLLPITFPFTWTAEHRAVLAQRVEQKIASMQLKQISQFVKARPHGISVDTAALESGASLEKIFSLMYGIAEGKIYRLEWREQREALVRSDLELALTRPDLSPFLQERITDALRKPHILSLEDDVLKRGEFLLAYRNFLKDHQSAQLRAIKQDAWDRALRLFAVPVELDPLYVVIDPYRRAYFLADDLPQMSLDEMETEMLADLHALEEQFQDVMTVRQGKKAQQKQPHAAQSLSTKGEESVFTSSSLRDYLERNLRIWDSDPDAVRAVPLQVNSFRDNLRRYVDAKRPDAQCCYCGSSLRAEEWMAMQVPANIGVQSFSNRLEGGSSREPKRNVCAVCRMQFLLEKLSWQSHKDKHGKEYLTFYLHLFPYAHFTQPLLLSWWQSVQHLKQGNETALLINSRDYLLQWYDHKAYFAAWQQSYQQFQEEIKVLPRSVEGLGTPLYSELLSNTPVLPLTVKETHYGRGFLSALAKTAVLTRWFGCRIILSRLPTPLLNLADQYHGQEPVALLAETIPQSMSWLLPSNALTQHEVHRLCERLAALHALARLLATDDQQFDVIISTFVAAASRDPLSAYHEVDRMIEQKVAQRRGGKPEYQAIQLARLIEPVLESLHPGEEIA